MPAPAEEMEKNQKILLWLMEGQKEMVQHKRSPYGSVMTINFLLLVSREDVTVSVVRGQSDTRVRPD